MNEKFPMTEEGLKKLKSELENLKNFERPNVIKAIAEAREHGDLSENAEYHAARERQSFIEGRIVELENKIIRAEVIDISKLDNSKVAFGATVIVTDLNSDKKHTYKIVGVDEAEIEKNLISISAPLSKAMINKKVDDVFEVETPNGLKEYQINSINFIHK
ncbi:MAG: transcription elongation factor GreA [Pseudomonadota bacterium]|nr:transcription elongation factor GreA [Pseudomonadota bacterium]